MSATYPRARCASVTEAVKRAVLAASRSMMAILAPCASSAEDIAVPRMPAPPVMTHTRSCRENISLTGHSLLHEHFDEVEIEQCIHVDRPLARDVMHAHVAFP